MVGRQAEEGRMDSGLESMRHDRSDTIRHRWIRRERYCIATRKRKAECAYCVQPEERTLLCEILHA